MRIILCGRSGMLGGAFALALGEQIICDFSHIDLAPAARVSLDHRIKAARPDLVINCAAYTNVEAAERSNEENHDANVEIPSALARSCAAVGATLVHFSSTGCYGDWKSEPFTEDDELRPTTAYHRAKALGEDEVRRAGCRHIIARTGWLFGATPNQPKNFVWQRLVEASRAAEMISDATQVGCPTYTSDLIIQVLDLVRKNFFGTFNIVNAGRASRYQYVKAIVEEAGLKTIVKPGPRFIRLAAVSDNETSLNSKLADLGVDGMRDWRDALHCCVADIIRTAEWLNRSKGEL